MANVYAVRVVVVGEITMLAGHKSMVLGRERGGV